MPPSSSTLPPTTTKPPPKPPYVETETGNKVSRLAKLHGTRHITLGGRCVISPYVTIRGDLVRLSPAASSNAKEKKQPPVTSVTLGKYTILSPHVTLTPPSLTNPSIAITTDSTNTGDTAAREAQYVPMTIGSHTLIHSSCTISAASIGSHVTIEPHCQIGRMAILKDGCRVLRGSHGAGGDPTRVGGWRGKRRGGYEGGLEGGDEGGGGWVGG
ncbi:MAG: hypothetical protein Q9220_007819, partial [cf. Caloplaca sp. 1 TL-2023]